MPASLRALAIATATLLCCRSTAGDGENITREKDKIYNSSHILAKSLRRKLMKDNYDYMSTESGEPLAHGRSGPDPGVEAVRKEKHITDGEENNVHPVDKHLTDFKKIEVKERYKNIIDKLKDHSRAYSNTESNDEESVQKKKLPNFRKKGKKIQTYMHLKNEDILKRSRYRYRISDEDNSVSDQNFKETTTVKYTVLKIKDPYRRSGHAAALIQEESPQGVSILKLGIRSFPEFRLPRPRRQYMNVPQTLEHIGDDEGELPPPPVEDTSVADETAHTETNVGTPITIHVPKPYFNEGQNS